MWTLPTLLVIGATVLGVLQLFSEVAGADLQEVYKDDATVIYFNETIDKTKTKWIFSLYAKGWKHAKAHFGPFGGNQEGRLRGVFQTDSGEGGMYGSLDIPGVSITMGISPGSLSAGNLYDKPGTNEPNQRLLFDSQISDIVTIIQEGNNKMEGSPARAVWGKGGFAQIMIFDLFTNIGYKKEAEKWKNDNLNKAVDAPTAKNQVYWLRDWWLPTYDKYGKTKFLGQFFKLVQQNWPKNGRKYTGGMNVGQFVHFMSGAAKTNLRDLAEKALGWEQEDTDSFEKAKKDFPRIKY